MSISLEVSYITHEGIRIHVLYCVMSKMRLLCVFVLHRSHHVCVFQSGRSVHTRLQFGLYGAPVGQKLRGDAGRVCTTQMKLLHKYNKTRFFKNNAS